MFGFTTHANEAGKDTNGMVANIIARQEKDQIDKLTRNFAAAATSVFHGDYKITAGGEADPHDNNKHRFAVAVSGEGTGKDDSRAVDLINQLEKQGFKGKTISIENTSYDNHSGKYSSVIIKGSLKDLSAVASKQREQGEKSKGWSL